MLGLQLETEVWHVGSYRLKGMPEPMHVMQTIVKSYIASVPVHAYELSSTGAWPAVGDGGMACGLLQAEGHAGANACHANHRQVVYCICTGTCL